MSNVDDFSHEENCDRDTNESAKKSPGTECKTRRKIEEILELRQLRHDFGLYADDFDLGFEEAYS